jgi:uncharacterized protein (DUF1778 family)
VSVFFLFRRIAMRDASINLRAHAEQRDLIDQAARLLGKNRSDLTENLPPTSNRLV